jgi:hypothetical protein
MERKRGKAKHPTQPLVAADQGIVRFKPNKSFNSCSTLGLSTSTNLRA